MTKPTKPPVRKPIGFRATKDEIKVIDLAAVHTEQKRDQFLRDAALVKARAILAKLPAA